MLAQIPETIEGIFVICSFHTTSTNCSEGEVPIELGLSLVKYSFHTDSMSSVMYQQFYVIQACRHSKDDLKESDKVSEWHRTLAVLKKH